MHLYLLDEQGEAVPCEDVLTWAEAFERLDRQIALDYFNVADVNAIEGSDRVRVSTVFLGLDHNHFDDGPPLLWETMIFGGQLDGEQSRYTSRAEAVEGHQRMCRRVQASRR